MATVCSGYMSIDALCCLLTSHLLLLLLLLLHPFQDLGAEASAGGHSAIMEQYISDKLGINKPDE
jgi:hypothetical protein